MKRSTAIILFILILVVAKISEHPPAAEMPPEKTYVYRDGDRIIARDGFMDLPREEREKMLKNIL